MAGVGPARGVQEGIARLPSLDGRRAAVFCTCATWLPGGRSISSRRGCAGKAPKVTVGETFKRKKSLRQVPGSWTSCSRRSARVPTA